MKVSVVVPVYNPGANIDPLIGSLLGQSLPRDQYEAIFVDDGSTDGTGERLDAIAAEHANVRVEHIPNSGWPGRPRNVGTDLARGEYVFYADNDDRLAPRALERLYERARRDGADVVLGKVVGHNRRVPLEVFTEDRSGVTMAGWPPLLRMLTPHKLFRRAFLAEHGIRFPEGRRRLEDHMFVVHAYFHTDRVSVLTGRPVYHWVRHGKANASESWEAAEYCASLRDVLDLVEKHTDPGEERDRLLVHWLRGKVLGRMGGRNLIGRPPDERRALHAEMRSLAVERLPPRLDALLAFNLRVRAAVLRQGTYEDVERLAQWESRLEAVVDARVRPDGDALELSLEARLAVDGEALAFEGDCWVPPAAVRDAIPPGTDLALAPDGSPGLFLRHAKRHTEHVIGARCELRGSTLFASARLDPDSSGDGGRPLRAGRWRAGAVITIAGFSARVMPVRARLERRLRRPGEPEPVVLRVSERAGAPRARG